MEGDLFHVFKDGGFPGQLEADTRWSPCPPRGRALRLLPGGEGNEHVLFCFLLTLAINYINTRLTGNQRKPSRDMMLSQEICTSLRLCSL